MRALTWMGVIAGSLILGLGVLTAADEAKAEEKVSQERRDSMANADNERIVTDFCNAWSRLVAPHLTVVWCACNDNEGPGILLLVRSPT